MRDKEKRQQRNEDIRKEWDRLSNISEYGHKKFRNQWIIARISKKFYLAESTIEDIIFNPNKHL
ncbi:MAG: hypothetical protein N4A41_00465 [Crocinitomicaceae bacterium]|jgi:hypothetical protein|nr:hypothetical protein [Crocinitomicaceae bacterium]